MPAAMAAQPAGLRPNASKAAGGHTDAADAELQRRQQRLSTIASAAKEEVVQLRNERAQLADQLRQLSAAVGELPQPPQALTEAQTRAVRCLKDDADGSAGMAHVPGLKDVTNVLSRDADVRQLQKLVARTDCGLGALERDLRAMEAAGRRNKEALAAKDAQLAAAAAAQAELQTELHQAQSEAHEREADLASQSQSFEITRDFLATQVGELTTQLITAQAQLQDQRSAAAAAAEVAAAAQESAAAEAAERAQAQAAQWGAVAAAAEAGRQDMDQKAVALQRALQQQQERQHDIIASLQSDMSEAVTHAEWQHSRISELEAALRQAETVATAAQHAEQAAAAAAAQAVAEKKALQGELAALQGTLEQKVPKAAELQEQLAEAFQRIDTQSAEAATAQLAIREHVEAAAAAAADAARHEEAAVAAGAASAALGQQQAAAQRRIVDLVQHASDVQQEAAQRDADAGRLGEQLAEAMHRIDELTEVAASRQPAITELEAAAAAQAQQEAVLGEQLSEAMHRIDELSAAIAESDSATAAQAQQEVILKEQLSEAMGRIDVEVADNQATVQQAAALNMLVEEAAAETQDLQQQLAAAAAEGADTKQKLAAAVAAKLEAAQQASVAVAELASVQQQLATALAEGADTRQQLAAAAAAKLEARADAAAAMQQAAEKAAQLAAAEGRGAAVKEELAASHAELADARRQLTEAYNHVSAGKEALVTMRRKLEAAKAEAAAATARALAKAAAADEARADAKVLAAKLARATAAVHRLQAQGRDYEEGAEAARARIAGLSQQLTAAHDRVAALEADLRRSAAAGSQLMVFRPMAEAATQRAHALGWALAQLVAVALTSAAMRRAAAAGQAAAVTALAQHREAARWGLLQLTAQLAALQREAAGTSSGPLLQLQAVSPGGTGCEDADVLAALQWLASLAPEQRGSLCGGGCPDAATCRFSGQLAAALASARALLALPLLRPRGGLAPLAARPCGSAISPLSLPPAAPPSPAPPAAAAQSPPPPPSPGAAPLDHHPDAMCAPGPRTPQSPHAPCLGRRRRSPSSPDGGLKDLYGELLLSAERRSRGSRLGDGRAGSGDALETPQPFSIEEVLADVFCKAAELAMLQVTDVADGAPGGVEAASGDMAAARALSPLFGRLRAAACEATEPAARQPPVPQPARPNLLSRLTLAVPLVVLVVQKVLSEAA